MKKLFLSLTIFTMSVIVVNAQTKKDGTPDMRFKANKQANAASSTAPAATKAASKKDAQPQAKISTENTKQASPPATTKPSPATKPEKTKKKNSK